MGFPAGRLRDRIWIWRVENVSDGKGGFDRSWTILAAGRRAEVTSVSGRESLIAGALQGIESYRILIRKGLEVRASDQIYFLPPGASEAVELNVRSAMADPFFPREIIQIFADTETPQGAGE